MPQPKTVAHVDAKFDGRQVRFELSRYRATLDPLEQEIGSISAAWGRFGSGDWKLADVRAILTAAHPLIPLPRNPFSIRASIAELGGKKPGPEFRRVTPDEIDAVISRRPLATYAPLAGAIVTAAFLGLPASAAMFDEGQPIVADPEPAGGTEQAA